MLYMLVEDIFTPSGILRSQGYTVLNSRVHDSLRRVDPAGVALRLARAIQRRVYHVQGPLSLWESQVDSVMLRFTCTLL